MIRNLKMKDEEGPVEHTDVITWILGIARETNDKSEGVKMDRETIERIEAFGYK